METITDVLMGQAAASMTTAVSILARGAALLLLAGSVALIFRRAPAALRHHVWVLAMAGLLALPVLTVTLPDWRVNAPSYLTAFVISATGQTSPPPERDVYQPDFEGWYPASPAAVQAPAETDGAVAHGAPLDSARFAPLAWKPAFLAVWVLGFVLLTARLTAGMWRASRLTRRAERVTDREWTILVSLLSLRGRLRRDVRIVVSDEVNVPMAWGILGAWLVLPRGMESWPEDRRRVVVLHELAHLRRRDCLTQALSELAVALHWPNPLAWVAVRRMRSERERACDDAVIAAGTEGADYAHHLVEVARGLTRAARPVRAAVAMARSSELEGRVLAILDERRSRGGIGRRSVVVGSILLCVLVVPLSALEPGVRAEAMDAATGTPTTTDAVAQSASVAKPEPRLVDVGDSKLDAVPSPSTRQVKLLMDAADSGAPPTATRDTIEERVFRALAKALTSEDAGARRKAAHTLGTLESKRGVESLARAVRDDADAGVRAEAAWALGMIEDPAGVPALADAARDEELEVRRKAAWALGMIESPDATVALGPLLEDGDVELRKQAAWALGMIESAEGVDLLLPLLRDASPEVRNQAAWALGMIESSAAVGGLTSSFATEENAPVRAQIIWAVGMIEDREAIDTIVDAVEDPDADVRDQALWALGMVLN